MKITKISILIISLSLLIMCSCERFYKMPIKKELLKKYRQRRDFTKTMEPSTTKKSKHKRSNGPIFVVQKHQATHLHYDFRIEIDEILKSWVIPKGPSQNPKEQRLAIPTDDHPYDYAWFEGVISKGNYGAGTVMVWDIGTYKNTKEKDDKIVPIKQCFKDGKIEIWLDGKKMKGGYALIRMKNKDEWLLIKMNDEYANKKYLNEDKSALSGKSLEEIKK